MNAIKNIARNNLDIETFQLEKDVEGNFHDLNVTDIRAALLEAYRAGKESQEQQAFKEFPSKAHRLYLSYMNITTYTIFSNVLMDQQVKLHKQFKRVKHIGEAKKLIENFMRHTAEGYPEKVNTNFDFHYGVGDLS